MLFPFSGPAQQSGPTAATIVIAASTDNFNLYNALQDQGYNLTQPMTITLTVNASQVVGAAVPSSTPAMDLRNLPAGSTINLTNLGHILGRGGDGGVGGSLGAGGNGGPGGVAIYGPGAGNTLNITNVSGQVWGGGGGGGGGGAKFKRFIPGEYIWTPGTGGGGGAGGSAGGAGGIGDLIIADDGSPGTGGTAGAGGLAGIATLSTIAGGAGGAYGVAGSNGTTASGGTAGGTGGGQGYYIRSAGGTVNWISGGANVAGIAD